MKLSDWQALDARIAREVMGWVKWDGLPVDNQELVAIYNRRIWLRLDESGCPHSTDLLYKDWRPHENVAQALMAVRKIVQQGWAFQLRIYIDYREPHVLKSAAELWNYDVLPCEGYEETDSKAICLAIEAWLDAQDDGASG